MLAQLSTLKARLALDPLDATYDALLLRAIAAISARFDLETNRILARTVNFVQEFAPRESEVLAKCYPIECVSKFEFKSNEPAGWSEQLNVDYLLRGTCIISLLQPETWNLGRGVARVTYTGGYWSPGEPVPPPTGSGLPPAQLPAELEQAAVEQAVFWFQTRDKLGVIRQWPKGGSYEQFADPDLLPGREVGPAPAHAHEVVMRYKHSGEADSGFSPAHSQELEGKQFGQARTQVSLLFA